MVESQVLNSSRYTTVQAREQRSTFAWMLWFLGIVGLAGLTGLLMIRRGPSPSSIAFVMFLLGAVAILYRPRYGIYLVLFFGLAADSVLYPWYPFAKNFSSPESIMFIHDAIIFSPLEFYIALTFISWLLRVITRRSAPIYTGQLVRPGLVFLFFVTVGLVYGIQSGGDLTIALWEVRPMFYLVVMIVLASNLLEKRDHIHQVVLAAMLGMLIEAVYGAVYFFADLNGSLAGVDAISEHSAAIHLNTIFVLALTSWIYQSTKGMRFGSALMVILVAIEYLANQRRAGFVSLGIALVLLIVILFIDNRKVFWIIAPSLLLAGIIYLAIFWNRSGALSLPAQAVKSIIAPQQASISDRSSNEYRDRENVNTSFTIHQRPLTGVGFGQTFYVIVPMADISFFRWWNYFPHNSIIYIWVKAGIAGFLSMLYLVGLSIMVGTSAFLNMPRNNMRVIALTATLYLVMHFIFAYVDISWDTQSMIYLGAMMGLLNRLETIVALPVQMAQKRWHWQPDPQTSPS